MLYAVFVGINVYLDARIRNLDFAVADAKAMYDLFSRSIDSADTKLYLVIDQQATKLYLAKLIGEDIARQAQEDDTVIFYFAGHGTPEIGNTVDSAARYLVMHDSDIDAVFATGVNLEVDLALLLGRLRARLVLVFIDSCFSGRAGGRTFENPRLTHLSGSWRAKQKMSELDLGQGRIVFSAADDNEAALEEPILSHGVFTHFLIGTLADPEYPAYTISAAMLYDKVFRNVRAYTNDLQHPVMIGRSRNAQLPHLAPVP